MVLGFHVDMIFQEDHVIAIYYGKTSWECCVTSFVFSCSRSIGCSVLCGIATIAAHAAVP